MRSKWDKMAALVLLTVAPILLVMGCGGDDETENKIVEATLPLSNERIVNEQLLGTPTQGSSIHMLYEAGTRTYFIGLVDGSNTVGQLSNTGQLIWSTPQDDRMRGIYPFPSNTIGLTEGFVYVGGHSTDGDERVEEARIGLCGVGGVEIDERMLAKPDTTLWFNAIDRISDLKFVAVGSVMTAGSEYHPYAATFEIEPDSTLTLINEKVFGSLPDQYFVGVKVDPGKVTGEVFTCYATIAQVDTDTNPAKQFVVSFHGSTSDVAAYGMEWTVDLAWPEPLDMFSYLEGIELYDGSIYVAGHGDVTKEKGPNDGGYWDAGYIGSVSTTGVLNWLHVITLGKHSDRYYNVRATADALYVAGIYDRYRTTSDGIWHGLALISMFDRHTGAEIYHLGFGDDGYASGFYTIVPKNSHAFSAGSTHHTTSEGGYLGWFAEIDLDGVGNVGKSLLPVTAGQNTREDSPDNCLTADGLGGGRR